ncbi:PilZ domain-containing protein [Idiomarina ramblicola]|uniref:PilZ domain-containing protein n=1 Tax=Idiomarina ramblicola TaxID=263724 RepID=A0A432YV77_9GAMM|nr:PilZ domain-containing protein [Idiomarina ramblicola]RUO67220.1 PilZ domain-containing protein [Idiomarina ramblicola]
MSSDALIETLVDELKTDYHRSQFESLFKRKTAHLSGPEKLKLRMQITELAKPALGVVDLRKKIPAEVEPYTFQGRTHYFDLTARKIFEEGLRAYKGVFTNDTKAKILALKAHHQKLAEHKAQTQEEQDKALGSFIAGYQYERREERMNLVTSVKMELADGQKLNAMTVDVSLSGLQLKLPFEQQLAGLKHARVTLSFHGFSDDFVFDANTGYEYRVVGVKEKETFLYLRLKRFDESMDDELSKLLSEIVTKSRRRYKINVEHVAQRVIARGHEDYWFQAIQALPVLFSDNSSTFAVIKTVANQTLLNSWQQHQEDLLAELFEQQWVQSSISLLKDSRKATRRQVTFFRISLPVNKVWREYLLPLQALQTDKSLMVTLNALRVAGYVTRCYQLTITYSKEKQLIYAELNSVKTPLRKNTANEKPDLSKLQGYRSKGAEKLNVKLLSDASSAKHRVFPHVLSSALFLYKQGVEWEPQLAGLMSLTDGLPSLFNEVEFWLANGDRILGGRRLSCQLRKKLRQLSGEDKFSSRILLLRVSSSLQKEAVMGRDIQEYESFEEAAEYIRFLNDSSHFVAVLVSAQPCANRFPAELMESLSYIQRYLPHRAKELEGSFSQLQAVMTLTDVTQTLIDLSELTVSS